MVAFSIVQQRAYYCRRSVYAFLQLHVQKFNLPFNGKGAWKLLVPKLKNFVANKLKIPT